MGECNLAEVYDASELKVYIGQWEDEGWNYERVEYARTVSPDLADNTRRVYDGKTLKGRKLTRAENSFSIDQEFMGFDKGLYKYGNECGLLVKVVIEPDQGEAPEDDTRYYYNWNPNKPDWSKDDVGEFNVTLDGMIDDEYAEEPVDGDFTHPDDE